MGARSQRPSGEMSADPQVRRNLADAAHAKGDVAGEIELRRQYSDESWAAFARLPRESNKELRRARQIDRWSVVYLNDLPLARLLAGTHRWAEAETIFKRNRAELNDNVVAGNDIKSENEMQLAFVLRMEGKAAEGEKICRYWQGRVKRNADFALRAVETNIPTPPLYDTPNVETGAWDLWCDKPDEGLALLAAEMAAHPEMLVPHTVLSEYYVATGRFAEALKAEKP